MLKRGPLADPPAAEEADSKRSARKGMEERVRKARAPLTATVGGLDNHLFHFDVRVSLLPTRPSQKQGRGVSSQSFGPGAGRPPPCTCVRPGQGLAQLLVTPVRTVFLGARWEQWLHSWGMVSAAVLGLGTSQRTTAGSPSPRKSSCGRHEDPTDPWCCSSVGGVLL